MTFIESKSTADSGSSLILRLLASGISSPDSFKEGFSISIVGWLGWLVGMLIGWLGWFLFLFRSFISFRFVFFCSAKKVLSVLAMNIKEISLFTKLFGCPLYQLTSVEKKKQPK